MTYKDAEKQKAYQAEWVKRRRAKGIEHLGGRCADCGGRLSLEVDHIDPTLKVSHRIWSWRWDRVLAELEKCQLLCHTCHNKKTQKQRPLQGCGTVAKYYRGCRCVACKDARNSYERARRKR